MTQNQQSTSTVAYDIRINEQQRYVLQQALKTYMSAVPGEQIIRDENGDHVADLLDDMLDDLVEQGEGINSFVM